MDMSETLLTASRTDLSPNTTALIKSVDVPLTSTAEFFEILYDDVAELEKLQAQQQEELNGEIIALSSDIRTLSRPSKTKFHKSDLYRWRELFEIYLHANIFFSTRELDHGKRTASAAAKQLEWFQHEVNRRDLIPSFRHPASRQALQRFLNINLEILMNLKFQEINKQAISKILKSKYSHCPS
jgi:E3 ubiquitin-protein ligase BAH